MKHNYEKQTNRKCLIMGVCVLALAGCGTKQMEIQGEKDMPVTEQYQNDISDIEDMSLNGDEKDSTDTETCDVNGKGDGGGKVDAESLYASAVMTGSVVEFTDGGCTVSAAVTEDDGKTGVITAPGYESEDTNVEVAYQEGCVVQIAAIDISTGMAELEQASAADIKKQASVIIYGSFEDTHHVTATKIIICHRTV